MNKCTPKSFSGNNSAGEQFKKSRKKKYRNRKRNSSFRKRKTKKIENFYKSNSFKSKVNDSIQNKIMSNWYWSNYKKAMEWQDKHKIAHWKACALSLLEENRCLLQIIKNIKPNMDINLPFTQQILTSSCAQTRTEDYNRFNSYDCSTYKNNCSDASDDSENNNEMDDDEFEFEMSEEMIKFFENSYKHKMELKKLKEKELLDNVEEKVKEIQQNKIKRSNEMSILYGDGASMIVGMETAVQLSFDKYCDSKSPKYWPNIPLRF